MLGSAMSAISQVFWRLLYIFILLYNFVIDRTFSQNRIVELPIHWLYLSYDNIINEERKKKYIFLLLLNMFTQ